MKQSHRALFIAAALTSLPGLAMAHGGGGDPQLRAQCRAQRDATLLPRYDANKIGRAHV